jgi:hypothetical protein
LTREFRAVVSKVFKASKHVAYVGILGDRISRAHLGYLDPLRLLISPRLASEPLRGVPLTMHNANISAPPSPSQVAPLILLSALRRPCARPGSQPICLQDNILERCAMSADPTGPPTLEGPKKTAGAVSSGNPVLLPVWKMTDTAIPSQQHISAHVYGSDES